MAVRRLSPSMGTKYARGTKTLVKIFHPGKYGGKTGALHKLQIACFERYVSASEEIKSVQNKSKKLLTVCPPSVRVTSHTVTKQTKHMRTKTLLAAAAIIAAGVASSQAQSNVYSLNIVGYVNKPVSVGYNLIANPLNNANNSVTNIIQAPDFTDVLKWNSGTVDFDISTYFFGAWTAEYNLVPGEAFFVNAGTAFTNTFVGEVLTGSQTNAFIAGLSFKSAKIPIGGNADTLGLTAALTDFDNVSVFDNGINDYIIGTYFFGAWDVPVPQIPVASGVLINSSVGGNWIQTLTP